MDITKEVQEASRGYDIWRNINDKYDITDSDCVICFPTENKKLNDSVIQQLDEYGRKKYIDRYIFLCKTPILQLKGELDDNFQIELLQMNSNELNDLMRFFRLINVMKNVVIVSDQEPFSNFNMIGKYGITLETFVAGSFLWRTDVTNI